jgi:Ca2+/Na+ antiporter
MKKILIPLMIICIFIAFNEQNKVRPNQIITSLVIMIFVFGMIKLSSKTPSKNQNQDDENI